MFFGLDLLLPTGKARRLRLGGARRNQGLIRFLEKALQHHDKPGEQGGLQNENDGVDQNADKIRLVGGKHHGRKQEVQSEMMHSHKSRIAEQCSPIAPSGHQRKPGKEIHMQIDLIGMSLKCIDKQADKRGHGE